MLTAVKKVTFGVLCTFALLSTTVLAYTPTSITETWSFKPATTTTDTGANTLVNAASQLRLDSSYGVQLWNNTDSGSPSHAVDNQNGFDFILLEFPNPVELLSLTNAWYSRDSDVSVGAFNSNP
ncbi:hypothetical protein ORI99_13135, partial [Alishewanella sp. SMS9]|nr:hypothetical protein [Alishewanella sp. SMS9]